MKNERGGITLITLIVIIVVLLLIAMVLFVLMLITDKDDKEIQTNNPEMYLTSNSKVEENTFKEKNEYQATKNTQDSQVSNDYLASEDLQTFEDVIQEFYDESNINENLESYLGFKIGDYVDYKPSDAGNYNITTDVAGLKVNTTNITQNKEVKWRIFDFLDDGSILLISEDVVGDLSLSYANGYNNGVYLLNDICAKHYSNNSLGIIARSLTIEDVEGKMNNYGISSKNNYSFNGDYKLQSAIKYAQAKEYSSFNYPVLYKEETTKNIGKSESYYNSPLTDNHYKVNNNSMSITQTGYNIEVSGEFFDSNMVYDLIFNVNRRYWLASRKIDLSSRVGYGMFCINGLDNSKRISGDELFNSEGNGIVTTNAIRPVVKLDSNIITKCIGTNTSNNMHIIQ